MNARWRLIMICSLLGSLAQATEISFESDVRIKKLGDNSFSELKSGASASLADGESLTVLTPKGIPVVIHAPSSSRSKITLTDSNLSSIFDEKLQPSLERTANEVVDGLRKAEVLIKKKDYSQARALVNDLKNKYPRISALLFMSGTIHYLMNDKPSAVEDLEKGLQIDSQNEPARKLLAQMRGTP